MALVAFSARDHIQNLNRLSGAASQQPEGPLNSNCMICGAAIIDDSMDEKVRDTFEHLFPESIGGRRGVRRFIHRGCNNTAGAKWDSELAKQLQPLCLMFDIARQRGVTPAQPVTTTASEQATIGPGGKLTWASPRFEKRTGQDGQVTYSVRARNLTEVGRILKGLKKKHPQLDVASELEKIQVQEAYLDGLVHHDFNFGGPISGRSIVKSGLAMAFKSGIDWELCNLAVPYLRDTTAEPCFGYFQERDLVSGRQAGMPLHCLAVHAEPSSGLILCYAEYFGIHRVVACLGHSYTGTRIKENYAIDPRNGIEQNVEVDLSFSPRDISEIYEYKRCSREVMMSTLDAIIGPEIKRQHDAEFDRVLRREIAKAWDECRAVPNEPLTEMHLQEIARTFTEGIYPLLVHRMRPISHMLNSEINNPQYFDVNNTKDGKLS